MGTAVLAPKDQEALTKIDELTKDLATIESISEIKTLDDHSSLLQGLMRKSNVSTEIINRGVVAKAKIGRRGGEILALDPKAPGAKGSKLPPKQRGATMTPRSSPTLQERLGTKTAMAAKNIARRWAILTKLSVDDIEKYGLEIDVDSGLLLELTMRALYEAGLGQRKTDKPKARGRLTDAEVFGMVSEANAAELEGWQQLKDRGFVGGAAIALRHVRIVAGIIRKARAQ